MGLEDNSVRAGERCDYIAVFVIMICYTIPVHSSQSKTLVDVLHVIV